MKHITQLDVENKQAANYYILLQKILEAEKSIAFKGPILSATQFLENNKKSLLSEPLVLYSYSLHWLNPVTLKSVYKIDLMPAFSKASDVQTKQMHVVLLKLASEIFVNERDSILSLHDKMYLELPEDNDNREIKIVEKLFNTMTNMPSVDVSEFSDMESAMENFQKNDFFNEFLTEIRKPGVRWEILFKHLVLKIEEISANQEVNPLLENLISEIKSCNYQVSKLSPFKLINLFSKLNVLNFMQPHNFSNNLFQRLETASKPALEGGQLEEGDTAHEACKDGHCPIEKS